VKLKEHADLKVVGSPASLLPEGVSDTLHTLVQMINTAKSSLRIQVYEYNTKIPKSSEHWNVLDTPIREAAARGVHVQLLVDKTALKEGRADLKALAQLPNIQVKVVTIPEWSGGPIPFARLVHSKYCIIDHSSAWVGSENWSANYFTSSRNVGVTVHIGKVIKSLTKIFDKVWTSSYTSSGGGGGGGLAHLQEAIARANSGGAPISVLQYGDSHVAGRTEPKAIEDALKSLGPVQYDTMAKVGISANYPLTDPTNWLDKPIQKDHPDLVILSFGSNDSAGNVNQAAYEQSYQKLIDNVRERDPNASILIVGPSDGDSITGANKGNTLPGLDNVVAAQKAVAEKNGLDFFDLRQSMGGPGSIEDWHSKGLAADDKLHFTTKGYELIGNAVANHIKDQVHK
jgi:lysophospholipase L1-like esterase/HKD family nuclease